ncbi:unnamed protein product [Sympodiomycopsis kandeliae]
MYGGPPPLPTGWSQHAAPNGQPYYFNAATGQSTHEHPLNFGAAGPSATSSVAPPASKPKKEKPKHKDPIPGAPGWIRVTTNLGNIFYTHPESKRSEWTVPDEIKDAVDQMSAQQGESRQSPPQDTTPISSRATSSSKAKEEQDQKEEDAAAQLVNQATSASDGKRKRQEEAEESDRIKEDKQNAHQNGANLVVPSSHDGEPGIDAADLIGAPSAASEEDGGGSEEDSQPENKRQRTEEQQNGGDDDDDDPDDDDDDDDDDDEAEWQRQMAEEMAAEAEQEQEQEQEQQNQPSSSDNINDKQTNATPPSAPPNPFPSHLPPPAGYTGPPPGFAAQAAAATPAAPLPSLSLEEGRALFMHMLTSLNDTKDEVNPMAPWDKELPKFVYKSEYTSLGQLKDRQDAFNDWCRDRLKEKRELKRKGQTTMVKQPAVSSNSSAMPSPSGGSSLPPSDAYRKLLESEIKSTRARFDDFRRDFKKDRRFYGFGRDDREREKIFKTFLRELGEQKRKAAEEAEREFLNLLEELLGPKRESQWLNLSSGRLREDVWRDLKKTANLEKRKEYDAVGSSSRRAELFVQWVRGDSNMAPSSSSSKAGYGESSSGSKPRNSDDEAKERRERALRERQEQVERQRFETERKNRRALNEAHREEGAILFGQLLVDAVRDPLTTWSQATEDLRSDSRFETPGLAHSSRRQMFDDHIDKLIDRKRDQLNNIFHSYAPQLNTDAKVALPLIKEDPEYHRLDFKRFITELNRMDERDSLHKEFESWSIKRKETAKKEFFEMLKEDSFVQFWGSLRSENSKKGDGDDEDIQKALKQNEEMGDFHNDGDEEDGDNGNGNLAQMANQIDLEQIHSVLRNDQRYRVWKFDPELRDQWIREHLNSLSGRSRTVFSKPEKVN